MLDINFIRENPGLVKASEKRRGKDSKQVDVVFRLDREYRDSLKKAEQLRHERNEISQKVNQAKKAGQDISPLIARAKNLPDEIKELDEKAGSFLKEREQLRYKIGNILHKSVPEKNRVIRVSGKKPKFNFRLKSHVDLIKNLDLADSEKAAQVSGARFYYLKNELVMLNLALQKFAIDYLIKKGYKPIFTPFMLGGEAMKGAAELGDFKETLYKVEGENLYLIATSEQTIISYHCGEIIPEQKLPLKYAGFSTNFRKEAGAHGKDTKGIFRTHQFDKVEEIVFCKPEDSWRFHEEMTKIAEEMYKKLGLHYRVVNIGAREMNDNGAKKYDIEVWFPVQKTYREVGSGTNCTDYQARKSRIRVQKTNGNVETLHTLNCTGIATERTIVAILENFQQKDSSIKIPKVLWKYTGFRQIRAPKSSHFKSRRKAGRIKSKSIQNREKRKKKQEE